MSTQNAEQVAAALFLDPTITSEDAVILEEPALFNIDGGAAAAQGRSVATWPEDVPVVVLSHDPAWGTGSGLYTEAQQTEWDEGQLEYAALTESGLQRDVPGAEHYIYRTHLEEVVQELEELLSSATPE